MPHKFWFDCSERPGHCFKSSLGEVPGKSGSVTTVLKERFLASSSRSTWEPIRNVCLARGGGTRPTDFFQNCCFRNSGGGPRDSCYTSSPVDLGVNSSLRCTGPPVMYIISELTYWSSLRRWPQKWGCVAKIPFWGGILPMSLPPSEVPVTNGGTIPPTIHSGEPGSLLDFLTA